LRAVAKGGTVVCAGIHMSNIPSFPYEILWEERTVRSVANLTRRDAEEFLALAAEFPIRTETHVYPLTEANAALDDLRHGRFHGAAGAGPTPRRIVNIRPAGIYVVSGGFSFTSAPLARSNSGSKSSPGPIKRRKSYATRNDRPRPYGRKHGRTTNARGP
jgi:hypothetical protein